MIIDHKSYVHEEDTFALLSFYFPFFDHKRFLHPDENKILLVVT
jgi:hypothetical protein